MVELAGLYVADPAERWSALGFDVRDSGVNVGGVRLQLDAPGTGITAWSLTGCDAVIDGLPVAPAAPGQGGAAVAHPNGAVAVDHVVVTTPAFDRTAGALSEAGLPLKRIAELRGTRMGFRRIGPAILELVEAPGSAGTGFWGLVIVVGDLDMLAGRLGERVTPIKPAMQPGRRIATVRPGAGLSTNVAFMDPVKT